MANIHIITEERCFDTILSVIKLCTILILKTNKSVQQKDKQQCISVVNISAKLGQIPTNLTIPNVHIYA